MINKSVAFPNWGTLQYTGQVNTLYQPHGLGTAVNGDGYRFEGTFQAGSLVTGKTFRPDGALWYYGEFKEYWWHGMGTGFGPDGTVLTGRWERDDFKDGTATHPDGRVVKYVNGKAV